MLQFLDTAFPDVRGCTPSRYGTRLANQVLRYIGFNVKQDLATLRALLKILLNGSHKPMDARVLFGVLKRISISIIRQLECSGHPGIVMLQIAQRHLIEIGRFLMLAMTRNNYIFNCHLVPYEFNQ